MKKFVIAYVDLFDNEMKMSIVEALSKEEALRNYLKDDNLNNSSYEEILEYCFDCDSIINILEI